MIVTCESCSTKFRLDPNRMKKPKSKVRCSRCGHVFVVGQSEDEELIQVDLSETTTDTEQKKPFSPPSFSTPAPAQPKKRLPVRKLILWSVPVLLVLFGIYWLVSQKGPGTSTGADAEKAASAEAQQPSVTILDSTQAYFLENSSAGQIFVVEGEVSNESQKPISFILLEGKLYGRDNRVAQSQRCFSGNVMTRDELHKLSITDIQNRMMNREGKELMNVHIAPSKRVPFVLVFQNLPELDALSDYSIEVISAKFD